MQAPETPSGILRTEHQIIMRVVEVLHQLVARSREGRGFERAALARCVDFFRAFADACHHAKEEDLLFPVLESRGIPREGGPIGVMLYEHKLAREHTRDMAEAIDAEQRGEASAIARFHEAADRYISLLTQHIFKENDVLFNMGDTVMTPDDQKSLCERFCEAGCRSFGGKTRAQLEQLADDLESRWGHA